MPEWISVILLGIIEGVAEFLPVSSTGHLQIAQRWLTPQSELFDIVVQCGAVLAVITVFRSRMETMIREWRSPTTRQFLGKLLLAFILTTVGVLLAEELEFKVNKEDVEASAWALRVAMATLIGGVLILMVEWLNRSRTGRDEITWTIAAAVGLAQVIAAIYSGTSRSGATILMAIALGAARPAATEFSFLLGVPTLLAAGGYKLLKAWRHQELGDENWALVLLGTAVATVMAFVAVKWLLHYVRSHTFNVFGWYRIGLGMLIIVMLSL